MSPKIYSCLPFCNCFLLPPLFEPVFLLPVLHFSYASVRLSYLPLPFRVNPLSSFSSPDDWFLFSCQIFSEVFSQRVHIIGTIGFCVFLRMIHIRLWEYLVSIYHYLGFRRMFGKRLQYIIWYEDQPLGAISFHSTIKKCPSNIRPHSVFLYVPQVEFTLIGCFLSGYFHFHYIVQIYYSPFRSRN